MRYVTFERHTTSEIQPKNNNRNHQVMTFGEGTVTPGELQISSELKVPNVSELKPPEIAVIYLGVDGMRSPVVRNR